MEGTVSGLKRRADNSEIVMTLEIKDNKGAYHIPRSVNVGEAHLEISPTDNLLVDVVGMSDLVVHNLLRKRVPESNTRTQVEINQKYTVQAYIACEPKSAKATLMLVWIGFKEPLMAVGRIYIIKGILKRRRRGGSAIVVREFKEAKAY